MISILAMAIFAFTSWAVFSKRFYDGLVVKNLLIFSAITAFLTVMDRTNMLAATTSIVLLVVALVYWVCQHHRSINHRARVMCGRYFK